MAKVPIWPDSGGEPTRWKVRPPLEDVKTFLMLWPGCGAPWSEHPIATLAVDAAATALAEMVPDGQRKDSADQCLPLSVDLHRFPSTPDAMPTQTERPNTVSAFCGAMRRTSVHLVVPTRLSYSLAWLRPVTGSDTANTTPSDAASAITWPGRDIRCHFLPPSVVAHSAGANSQPSRAFSNRTELAADAGAEV